MRTIDGLAWKRWTPWLRSRRMSGTHTLLASATSASASSPRPPVLNSVFLHHAGARPRRSIMHVSGIVPLYKVDEEHRRWLRI